MATVEIGSKELIIHVTGMGRFLAFKSSISIPWEHVLGVEQNAALASEFFHGLRIPGTSLPGVITAGSYLKNGEWSFWDVHDPRKAITVNLRDEHYSRLVIGVEDPEAAVQSIAAALR